MSRINIGSGIVLQVGDSPTLNFKLDLGSTSESVKVAAGASLVQRADFGFAGDQPGEHCGTASERAAGHALILISGAATVTPAGDMSGSKNYASSTTISIGGGQADETNYLLDGGDNTDMMTNVNLPFPFLDALQEFSVDTNALPARNGTKAGGLVNIVTKSGTNSLHGDAFEFLRNGSVNARNFFAPSHGVLKRNQFGGTLCGRIIRDKLFMFGGYQGTRIRNLPTSSARSSSAFGRILSAGDPRLFQFAMKLHF